MATGICSLTHCGPTLLFKVEHVSLNLPPVSSRFAVPFQDPTLDQFSIDPSAMTSGLEVTEVLEAIAFPQRGPHLLQSPSSFPPSCSLVTLFYSFPALCLSLITIHTLLKHTGKSYPVWAAGPCWCCLTHLNCFYSKTVHWVCL